MINLKFYISIILVLIICNLFFIQSLYSQTVSFSEFLQRENFYVLGREAMEKSDYEKAVVYIQKAIPNIERQPWCYKSLGESFFYLKDYQNALKYYALSFTSGLDMKGVDVDFIAMKKELIETIYREQRIKYLSSIDTILRTELYNMCTEDQRYRLTLGSVKIAHEKDSLWKMINEIDTFNIRRLKEIVAIRGWVGRSILGIRDMKRFVDPTLIVIHSNESNNIHFFNEVIKDATENKSSWYDAISIMKNLLWRFAINDVVKLRNVYLNDNLEIDIEKSELQLYSLAQLTSDNPHYKIELSSSYYKNENMENTNHYEKALIQIKEYLIMKGVPKNLISISNRKTEVEDDGLGKCIFLIKRYKN